MPTGLALLQVGVWSGEANLEQVCSLDEQKRPFPKRIRERPFRFFVESLQDSNLPGSGAIGAAEAQVVRHFICMTVSSPSAISTMTLRPIKPGV